MNFRKSINTEANKITNIDEQTKLFVNQIQQVYSTIVTHFKKSTFKNEMKKLTKFLDFWE